MISSSTDKVVDEQLQWDYIIACDYFGLRHFKGSYEFKQAMIQDYRDALGITVEVNDLTKSEEVAIDP